MERGPQDEQKGRSGAGEQAPSDHAGGNASPRPGRRWLRRTAIGVLALVGLCVVGGGVTTLALDRPRPEGRRGPEADALARAIQSSVGVDAFRELGAVAFTFGGRRSHLWDRQRGYDLVTTGDQRVYLRIATKTGRVFEGETEVTEADAVRDALDGAYQAWVNDTFWLNPFPKLFDPGVERALVEEPEGPGTRGLLVTFGQGGVTPGDSYLFLVDEPKAPPGDDARPTAWRMWVQILPIGGLRTTWEDWVTLPGGARVATTHAGLGPITLELSEVRGAAAPRELVHGSGDPFSVLEVQEEEAPAGSP